MSALKRLSQLDWAQIEANYRPFKVKQNQLIPKIIKTLPKFNQIYISGPSHNDFDANTQIGKSYMMTELSKMFKRMGISYTYLDCRDIVSYYDNHWYIFAKNLYSLHNSSSIWNKNIIIFDEIHMLFPRLTWIKKELVERWEANGAYRDKITNDDLMFFWDNLKDYLSKGGKCIYATAEHPLDHQHKNVLINSTILSIFKSQLIELTGKTETLFNGLAPLRYKIEIISSDSIDWDS